MKIPQFLQNVLPQPKPELNPHYEVRKESFFINDEHHKFYLKHGWCKIENVVSQDEINSFRNTYNEISRLEGFQLDTQFLNTGCLVNPDIRSKTTNIINKNVQTILPRMFDMAKVETNTGGSFVIKPPHEESELPTHQDSSFIDEENDYCLFMWVPFCDVNENNGPMLVLSGSHLWGNTQRSLTVPWNLQKHISVLNKYMLPVYANAGDVILFDPALIHSSRPNLSKEIRPAITITVVRKNPKLVHFFKNELVPEDLIEKYYVNEQFFNEYDFASKPDESIWKKEVVKYNSFDLSEKELKTLIEKYLPA